jgi:hypothetical protein
VIEPARVGVDKEQWDRDWSLCRDALNTWLTKFQSPFRNEELMRQFERLKGNCESNARYKFYA